MGYTHYFGENKPIPDKAWSKICEKAHKILEYVSSQDIKLVYEYNEIHQPPVISDKDPKVIRFNGPEEEGHETFSIAPESTGFNFCKTARKPYDLAVGLVLLAVHDEAPGCCDIGSDGRWNEPDEWLNIWHTYNELFDADIECPWEVEMV